MKIKLPYVDEVVYTESPPENLKELVERSFREYTKDTSKIHRNEDRLAYIDSLRMLYIRNSRTTFLEKLLFRRGAYLVQAGSNLHSNNVIAEICRIVLNYEGEEN